LFNLLCELATKNISIELIISDERINTFQSKIGYKNLVDSSGNIYLANKNLNRAIVHNKYCIIDEQITITGSFNWTFAANNNKENIVVIQSPEIASQYIANFSNIKEDNCIKIDFKETYVPVPFTPLKDGINKLYPSEFMVFTGSQEKLILEFLFSYILENLLQFNIPIGFLSSYSSERSFINRLMSLYSEVSMNNLMSGNLEEYQWKSFHEFTETFDNSRLIYHNSTDKIEDLKNVISQFYSSGCKLIIIESLNGFITSIENTGNRSNKEILREIKSLAREIRIPFITTQTIYSKSKQADISIRNTFGVIDDFADVILEIKETDEGFLFPREQQMVQFSVAKQNLGNTEDFHLSRNHTTGRIFEEKFDVFGGDINLDNDDIPF